MTEPDLAIAPPDPETALLPDAETPPETDTVEQGDEPSAAAEPELDDDDSSESGGNEAAKYRRRLREAEAQRDTATTRLATLQANEAARLAGTWLADGHDLFLAGVEIGSLLDATGDVDPAMVDAACTEVLAAHPNWRAPVRSSAAPGSSVTSTDRIGGSDEDSPSWTKVIQGRV